MMCNFSENLSIAVFDSRGNGDGGVVPTITGDHENRITDYTALLILDMTRRKRVYVNPREKAPIIQVAMGTDGGNVPMVLMTIASTSTHAEMTDGRIAPTLLNRAGTGGNQLPILILEK